MTAAPGCCTTSKTGMPCFAKMAGFIQKGELKSSWKLRGGKRGERKREREGGGGVKIVPKIDPKKKILLPRQEGLDGARVLARRDVPGAAARAGVDVQTEEGDALAVGPRAGIRGLDVVVVGADAGDVPDVGEEVGDRGAVLEGGGQLRQLRHLLRPALGRLHLHVVVEDLRGGRDAAAALRDLGGQAEEKRGGDDKRG